MITKEKILKILHKHSYNVEDQAGNHLIVVDDDSWDEVATEILPKNTDMINAHKRLEATCRRLKFETLKAIGIFYIIEKIPWFNIKEPWNRLYKRSKNK